MTTQRRPEGDTRICIMGMGYVGLTLAAVMAEAGFSVVGVEIRQDVLADLHEGKAHFYERNLEMMLRRGLRSGSLRFAERIPDGEQFDVYIITVGTPLAEDGRPKMSMVENVAHDIAGHMADGALVVLRSTVRLGTSMKVVKPILDSSGRHYDLSFCPERTIEGTALVELRTLPQVVGADSPAASERAMKLFRHLTPTVVEVSSIETAEIIKLLDNSFRDVFFSFGNEVALMAERLGLDAHEIIHAANTGYERTNIARPGFVGGPCLHKDPHILMDSLSDVDFTPKLISSARAVNESLVPHVIDIASRRLESRVADGGEGLVVTVMGLAFKGKPDTDDTRNSPALDMIASLRRRFPKAELRGQDYVVARSAIAELGVVPVDDTEAFRGADLVIVMNNNRGYEQLDVEPRSSLMRAPGLICDCWNVLPVGAQLQEGIDLYVLGA